MFEERCRWYYEGASKNSPTDPEMAQVWSVDNDIFLIRTFRFTLNGDIDGTKKGIINIENCKFQCVEL